MFNPDGGEFERSGNGLRIAGVYLRREAGLGRRRSGDGRRDVSGGDRVWLEVAGPGADGAWDVRVEMGRAGFPDGPPFVAEGWLGSGDGLRWGCLRGRPGDVKPGSRRSPCRWATPTP